MVNKLRQKRTSSLSIKAMLTVAAVAIIFVADSSSQNSEPPPIQIKANDAQSVIRKIEWSDTSKPPHIPVDFEGDGINWRFVWFDTIPPGNEITVNGAQKAYTENERLTTGTWYPFKSKLSLLFSIGKDNFTAKLSRWPFQIASAKELSPDASLDDVKEYAKDSSKLQNKESHSLEVYWGRPEAQAQKIIVNQSKLEFEVGEQGITPIEQNFEITGTDPLWRFVRFKNLNPNIKIILSDENMKEEVTGSRGTELESEGADRTGSSIWYGFRETLKLKVIWAVRENWKDVQKIKLTLEEGEKQSGVETRKDAEAAIKGKQVVVVAGTHDIQVSLKPGGNSPVSSILIAVIGVGGGTVLIVWAVKFVRKRASNHKKRASFGEDENDPKHDIRTYSDTSGWSQPAATTGGGGSKRSSAEESVSLTKEGANPSPSSTNPPKLSGNQGAQNSGTSAGYGGTEGGKDNLIPITDLIERKLTELQQALKADQGAIVIEVENKLRGELENIKNTVDNSISALTTKIEQQEQAGNTLLKNISSNLENYLNQSFSNLKQSLEHHLNKDTEPFREILKQTSEEQEQQDKLYAKLLGCLSEANIDVLQQGNFESAIQQANSLSTAQVQAGYGQQNDFEGAYQKAGQILNNELRDQIPAADSLNALKLKAEAIYGAMKRVAGKAEQIAPRQASTDLSNIVNRAKEIDDYLASVQSQLQNRTLEIKPHVRFSAHENARYTFIEELGLAIKRELDRIRDPQGYFRRELHQLAISGVVTISDICDKQITGRPGYNQEIENALQALFQSAGLRSILPRPGESFDATEQHLVEMLYTQPIQYQTIAEVVSRGFYYYDGKKDVLHRKAGVKVYR
jgi:hypothetical protein